MQHSWKIRILNTCHQDAEVIISQPTLLGSDEEHVDLVISEDYISAKFLEFLPNDTGIKLQPLNDDVIIEVDGLTVDQEQNVPLQKPIAVGRLLIAVAPIEQSWNKEIDKLEQRAPGSQMNSIASENNTSTKNTPKSMNKIATIGGLIVLLISVAAIQLSNDTTEAETSSGTVPSTDIAEDNLAEQSPAKHTTDSQWPFVMNEFPMVELKEHEKVLIATGYVISDEQRNELMQYLSSLGKAYEFRVQSMQEIRAAALLILANLNLSPIALEIGNAPGSLRAVVDGKNLSGWRRAETILKKDISGLLSWKLDIPKPISPMEQLNMLIAESSLNGKVTLQDKGDSINMIARLNSTQAQVLGAVVSQFKNRIGDHPKLVQITPDPKKKAPSLKDLGIRAVRSGESPYVTLNDGKRYLPGSRLPNGNSLTDIDEGHIEVTADNKSFIIRYDIDPVLENKGTLSQIEEIN